MDLTGARYYQLWASFNGVDVAAQVEKDKPDDGTAYVVWLTDRWRTFWQVYGLPEVLHQAKNGGFLPWLEEWVGIMSFIPKNMDFLGTQISGLKEVAVWTDGRSEYVIMDSEGNGLSRTIGWYTDATAHKEAP